MNKKTASKVLTDIFASPPAGEAGPHVSNENLCAWGEETLAGAEFDRVQDHLDRCPECADLATRLVVALAGGEPLNFPVFVPRLEDVLARKAGQEAGGFSGTGLRLAASENDSLPEVIRIDGMLPGFSGEATGDARAPSCSSTLRLAFTAAETPRPSAVPGGVLAVWPTGQTPPVCLDYRGGRWRAVITLPLPWPQTVALLKAGRIRLDTI